MILSDVQNFHLRGLRRTCPECGVVFTLKMPRQKFCSRVCQLARAMRRLDQRPVEARRPADVPRWAG